MERHNTGIPEFKIANLFEDIETLKSVQAVAIKILEKDPKLEQKENICLQALIKDKFTDRIEI